MTHGILIENNQMLKYICSYINHRLANTGNEYLEQFMINLAADKLGWRMR